MLTWRSPTRRDPERAGAWDAYGAQSSLDGSELVYQQRHATTKELGNLFVLDVKTGRRTQYEPR